MFRKISNSVLRSLDRFKMSEESKVLTNTALLEQMVAHFKRQLEEHSVRKRMLYPMMFYIFIHPDDWARRKDDLQFIILEIIDEFYEVIFKSLGKYPKYTPPAKEWFFQFSELNAESVVTDSGEKIALQEQGCIHVMSRLLAPNVFGNNGVQETANVKFSLCVKNSDIDSTVNINPEAIAKIDKWGEGVITRKFDMTLGGLLQAAQIPEQPSLPTMDDGDTPIPELSWETDRRNYHYKITNKYIIVSGPQETMGGDHILKIDSPYVQTKHLRIEWDGGKQQYLICAFAPTILNSREMEIGTEESPKYYVLANNSSIILNQLFKITFKHD